MLAMVKKDKKSETNLLGKINKKFLGFQKFIKKGFEKKDFTIEGEEDKIVKEVDTLLKEENELKKEEKKIQKEIEMLVKKTLKLFELSKESIVVQELEKALEQPVKDTTDVKKVLKIIDNLLAKLPEEEIERFAKSEASKIYEKVMKKYGIK